MAAKAEELKKDEKIQGFLYQSLARTNAQIRAERGEAIAEDLEMSYKRAVEDLSLDLRRLERTRTNMFDFSPTNSQSLVMAKELESSDIKDKDLSISIDIRNTQIKLDIAIQRYEFLFGK